MIICDIEAIINAVTTNAIVPILVALATYFFVSRLDENRNRRNTSKLGVAIMEDLVIWEKEAFGGVLLRVIFIGITIVTI